MVQVRATLKVFKVVLAIKTEKTQWNRVTNRSAQFVKQEGQQPITTCTSYDFWVCV